ncbi:MAG: WG repeat-containing protein [Tannerella sp.]|nr:WG repeat-containing protein [Tannerella sp.]
MIVDNAIIKEDSMKFCNFILLVLMCNFWGLGQSKFTLRTNEENIVIPESHFESRLFSEGLAIVQDSLTKKFGFANRQGDVVIPCIYLAVNDFKEGLAVVQDYDTQKFGYINRKNKVVIPFIYDEAGSFSSDRDGSPAFSGLAYVNIGNTDDRRYMLFTKGKWGLINRMGEEVLPVKYGYIFPLSEGMACIFDGEYIFHTNDQNSGRVEINGKYGFINSDAKIVIQPQFDDTDVAFKNGRVKVKKDDKEYMINTKGEKVAE